MTSLGWLGVKGNDLSIFILGVPQELAYLSAVLALKKGQGPEKVIEFLNEAIELHFAGIKVGTRHVYPTLSGGGGGGGGSDWFSNKKKDME